MGKTCFPPQIGTRDWISPLAGVKRARVSSGGVTDSPGAFSKHVRSDMDFSPVKGVLG